MPAATRASKSDSNYGTKASLQVVSHKKNHKRKGKHGSHIDSFDDRVRELQERYLGTSAYKDKKGGRDNGVGIMLHESILPDKVASAITAHQEKFDSFFSALDSSLERIDDTPSASLSSVAKLPVLKTSSRLSANMYEVLAESDDNEENTSGISFAPSILAANSSMPKSYSSLRPKSSECTLQNHAKETLLRSEYISTVDDDDDDVL